MDDQKTPLGARGQGGPVLGDLAAPKLGPHAVRLFTLGWIEAAPIEQHGSSRANQGQGQLKDEGNHSHGASYGEIALVAVIGVAPDELRALGDDVEATAEPRL